MKNLEIKRESSPREKHERNIESVYSLIGDGTRQNIDEMLKRMWDLRKDVPWVGIDHKNFSDETSGITTVRLAWHTTHEKDAYYNKEGEKIISYVSIDIYNKDDKTDKGRKFIYFPEIGCQEIIVDYEPKEYILKTSQKLPEF